MRSPTARSRWRSRANRGDEEKLQQDYTGFTTKTLPSRRTTTPNARDDRRRTRRAASRSRDVEAEAKLRRTAELTKPRIAYRETLKAKAKGDEAREQRRTRPVRRLLGEVRATPRGSGYPFVNEMSADRCRASTYPRSTGESRKRPHAVSSPDIHWSTSRPKCSTGRTIRLTQNEMSFKKIAGMQALKRSRRSASQFSSSRSTNSKSHARPLPRRRARRPLRATRTHTGHRAG